tara:strand:+ start:235 stop:558 length:324 start_codon:yes stop_codon:yes gene_type:complete
MAATRKIAAPKRLQILNLTYKVRFTDDGEMAEAAGWCDCNKQEIVLARTLSPDTLQEVFLHEVLHALAHGYALQFDDEEEKVVSNMASGICLFKKQNPSAWRWFNRL